MARRPAGRGRGVEPQVQGVTGDVDVAGQPHHLAEQGAGFVGGAGGLSRSRRARVVSAS